MTPSRSSSRREPIAWLNGRRLPLSQVAVNVFDTGFIQGVTIAEQLRTFCGQIFRLEAHLARLARSLAIVGLKAGVSLEEIARIACDITAENATLLDPADDQGVTIFVTPGAGPAYANLVEHQGPTVCVHTQPLAFRTWASKYATGDSLVISDVMHVPARCWPTELKCRSRMHYYLADQQAAASERGARALLLDERGQVTEASTANIVAYFADRGLVSPPKELILPGVSVAVLEELAGTLSIPFSHAELSVQDVAAADELLLCSTSPCVWSVTRLNSRPIGAGAPGPVCQRLLKAWNELVGLDIVAQANRFAARG